MVVRKRMDDLANRITNTQFYRFTLTNTHTCKLPCAESEGERERERGERQRERERERERCGFGYFWKVPQQATIKWQRVSQTVGG